MHQKQDVKKILKMRLKDIKTKKQIKKLQIRIYIKVYHLTATVN